jgi:hypothetical protein
VIATLHLYSAKISQIQGEAKGSTGNHKNLVLLLCFSCAYLFYDENAEWTGPDESMSGVIFQSSAGWGREELHNGIVIGEHNIVVLPLTVVRTLNRRCFSFSLLPAPPVWERNENIICTYNMSFLRFYVSVFPLHVFFSFYLNVV